MILFPIHAKDCTCFCYPVGYWLATHGKRNRTRLIEILQIYMFSVTMYNHENRERDDFFRFISQINKKTVNRIVIHLYISWKICTEENKMKLCKSVILHEFHNSSSSMLLLNTHKQRMEHTNINSKHQLQCINMKETATVIGHISNQFIDT